MIARGIPREEAGFKVRRWWLKRMPPKLGLFMDVEGTPYQGTALYVGNHLAYLDPVVVMMEVEAKVVAKAEVRKWPLVGLGASIIGTIFVQRDIKASREEAAKAIRDALLSGESILVFPEGTTHAGPGTLPFRPRSFLAAHMAGVPVQPIAIFYDDPRVPYIGNHTFIPHFFNLFRLKRIHGRVVFGPLLYGENTCEESRQWINDVLEENPILKVSHEPAQKT